MKKLAAVIVAAGSSTRMGKSIPKQFIKINNIPVLAYSLMAFQNSYLVDEIFVVSQLSWFDKIIRIANKFGISKLREVVPGGDLRQDSSLNGVIAAENFEYIAVHDAARPMIDLSDINKVIEGAFECGCSLLASKITDTVAYVDSNKFDITEYGNRENLIAVHTPQVLKRTIILKSLSLARDLKIVLTDDISGAKMQGHRVKVVFSKNPNIKLTVPHDLKLITMYFQQTLANSIHTNLS